MWVTEKRLVLFVAAMVVLIASTRSDGTESHAEFERLRARVEAEPQSIAARMDLAEAYLSLFDVSGDLEHVVLAESAAYHALEIDNRHIPGLNLMSRALTFEGRFADVLFVQNWSIIVDLENAESWGLLGNAFLELGKYRSVDSCFIRMVGLDEGFHSRVRLAAEAFDVGDIESAQERLSRALAIAQGEKKAWPDSGREISNREVAVAYELLARMHLARGDWSAALDAADASLRALPAFADALVVKATALRISRDFDAARILLKGSFDGSPGGEPTTLRNLKLKVELARVYHRCRWRHRSRPLVKELTDDYRRLYARFPDAVRRDYALFLLEWNIDPSKALALATEESRRRKDVYTYNCLSMAYFKNGMADLAWSTVAFALRKGTNQPEILYNAAVIAKALGKIDRYEKFVERVRKLNPKFELMYGSL